MLGSSAHAQVNRSLEALGASLGDLVWIAVTAGTALAAVGAFALLLRGSRADKLAMAQAEIMSLRAALDRTAALLEADDQRTLIWDSAVAAPHVHGGLPERVGAPAEKAASMMVST